MYTAGSSARHGPPGRSRCRSALSVTPAARACPRVITSSCLPRIPARAAGSMRVVAATTRMVPPGSDISRGPPRGKSSIRDKLPRGLRASLPQRRPPEGVVAAMTPLAETDGRRRGRRSDLDDDGDDHRAAAVVVADPPADDAAGQLADLVRVDDALGGGHGQPVGDLRQHVAERRVVDAGAAGVDLRA